MSALTLLIIRHAEKPGESWPGSGLTVNGVPDAKSPLHFCALNSTSEKLD